MRYSTIRKIDISDGPGLRVSLFTQGCPHHCPECFNPEAWSFSGGKEFTQKEKDYIIELCQKEHCSGLTILGGEPLISENLAILKDLLLTFREKCPTKTVWLWTGYTVEQLTKNQLEIVLLCDTIIDGPFINERKDLSLLYAGSNNQRLWDVSPLGVLLEREMPKINGSKGSK